MEEPIAKSLRNQTDYYAAREWYNGETVESRAAAIWEAMGRFDEEPGLGMLAICERDFDNLPRFNTRDWRQIVAICFLALELREENHDVLMDHKMITVHETCTIFSRRIAPKKNGEEFTYREFVTVYHPHDDFGRGIKPGGVNWSACGTMSPETAIQCGQLLVLAGQLCRSMPDPRPITYGSKEKTYEDENKFFENVFPKQEEV